MKLETIKKKYPNTLQRSIVNYLRESNGDSPYLILRRVIRDLKNNLVLFDKRDGSELAEYDSFGDQSSEPYIFNSLIADGFKKETRSVYCDKLGHMAIRNYVKFNKSLSFELNFSLESIQELMFNYSWFHTETNPTKMLKASLAIPNISSIQAIEKELILAEVVHYLITEYTYSFKLLFDEDFEELWEEFKKGSFASPLDVEQFMTSRVAINESKCYKWLASSFQGGKGNRPTHAWRKSILGVSETIKFHSFGNTSSAWQNYASWDRDMKEFRNMDEFISWFEDEFQLEILAIDEANHTTMLVANPALSTSKKVSIMKAELLWNNNIIYKKTFV